MFKKKTTEKHMEVDKKSLKRFKRNEEASGLESFGS